MTPELIAAVPALPLPVRLALLDADQDAPGWYVRTTLGVTLMGSTHDHPYGPDELRRHVTDHGVTWLPCNPLAIVEHARDLYGLTARVRVDQPDYGDWRCSLVVPAEVRRRSPKAKTLTARHACRHTAAIALLRKVGRRCVDCKRWTWGGPTRCVRCVERVEIARLRALLSEWCPP